MGALKLSYDRRPGVADLLDWAALVDDGVVLGKSGLLLAGYAYRGPDTAGATDAERNHVTARVNAALARLGSGWVTWTDAVRLPAAAYPPPEASHFPDPVTRLIDAERRRHFLAEGAHVESEHALLFGYAPPSRRGGGLDALLWDEAGGAGPADAQLATFRKTLEEVEDALGDALLLRRLGGHTVTDPQGRTHRRDELVNYLNFCLTGLDHPIDLPAGGMYLDAVLGGQELWTGDTPRIGDRLVACVAIEGMPAESHPNILDVLEQLPVACRWSSRMIHLDRHEAIGALKGYRRKWRQKVRGFWSQVFRTTGGVVDEDALGMAGEAEAAIGDASGAIVSFGHYTPVVVLMAEERGALLEAARLVVREVQRLGFACRRETVNAMEAWLGTLPGHPRPNIRRPLVHTLTLADLLPLSGVWAGRDGAPCPHYPPGSPPLLHAAASGSTPFRLNLHVGDVGHTLVFGPTGAGKSTLLGLIAAQFRRYPGATVCAFDKGRSLLPLALACGGRHYDIAADGAPLAFAPLAAIDGDAGMAWAQEWVATCHRLQAGAAPSPEQRAEIHRAMRLLRAKAVPERSLTDFVLTVQDRALRASLAAYTIEGPLGHLLDARRDGLETGAFTVFEIEELMGLGETALLPVLLHLFRRFESGLTGQPALLVLDEAWVMLGHPVFREAIRGWLKTLRRANCAVVLATQSLSDAVRSGLLDVLLESCPTKILLPNEEAEQAGTAQHPGPQDFYRLMGLNEAETAILAAAERKRHYYVVSPEGRRLIDLALGPVALAFVGASDRATLARVRAAVAAHGEDWSRAWLKERGVDHAGLA